MDVIALIEQLKLKDEKGIAEWYDYYAPPLYGIILRRVKTHTEAEEILQETLLTVIDTIHSHKEHNDLFGWMVSVSRMIALKNDPKRRVVDHSAGSSTDVEPGEKFHQELISGMDLTSKKILQFVYLENRTILEASSLLELPIDEVKVSLRSALEHINQRIKLLRQSK